MKLTARVTFETPEQRAELVRSFFYQTDYSPKNLLRIEDDKDAFIHLEFESKPPQAIIKAISQCKINTLNNFDSSDIRDLMTEYDGNHASDTMDEIDNGDDSGKVPEVAKEDADILKEVPEGVREEAEDEVVSPAEKEPSCDEQLEVTEVPADVTQTEEDESEATETFPEAADDTNASVPAVTQKEKKSNNKKRRFGKQKPSADDYLDIPEFETFVKQSATFSMFTEKVADWLGLVDDDKKYFEGLVSELSTLDKVPYEITTDEVKKANVKMHHNDYRRIKFGKTITEILESKGIEATLLPLLITVIKYANQIQKETDSELANFYKDVDEDAGAESETRNTEEIGENSSEVIEEIPATEKQNEEPKYLKCDAFAKILKSLSKDASPEDKANELLRAMGLEEYSKPMFKKACQLVQAAFSMEKFESVDDVLLAAGIDVGTRDGMRFKADFTKWINDYNKKNHVDRMKIIAFLRELKAILTQT